MRSARGGDPPHPARYARHPLPQRWRGLGSGCYHARQWTLVRTQTALAEANSLAMLYNWPRAIPLYVDAEREFRRLNHRKGVLEARLGWLRAQAYLENSVATSSPGSRSLSWAPSLRSGPFAAEGRTGSPPSPPKGARAEVPCCHALQ